MTSKFLYAISLFFLIACTSTSNSQVSFEKKSLIKDLAKKSEFLKENEPEILEQLKQDPKAVRASIEKKTTDSLEEIKSESKKDIPNGFWKEFEQSLQQYTADFTLTIPIELYKSLLTGYMYQLSNMPEEQLYALSQTKNFENSKLFKKYVNTDDLFMQKQPYKMKLQLKVIDNHHKRLDKVHKKYGVGSLIDKPNVKLTQKEKFEAVNRLSLIALKALQKGNKSAWNEIICNVKPGKVNSFSSIRKIFSNIDSFEKVSEDAKLFPTVKYQLTNLKYKSDVLRHPTFKFFYNSDYYRKEKECVSFIF